MSNDSKFGVVLVSGRFLIYSLVSLFCLLRLVDCRLVNKETVGRNFLLPFVWTFVRTTVINLPMICLGLPGMSRTDSLNSKDNTRDQLTYSFFIHFAVTNVFLLAFFFRNHIYSCTFFRYAVPYYTFAIL